MGRNAPLALAVLILASENVAQAAHSLPPSICEALLEQTYGALRGWTPSEGQLLQLCTGLMVRKLHMARTADAARGPCRTFAQEVFTHRSSVRGPLPALVSIKQQWCTQPALVLPPPQLPVPAAAVVTSGNARSPQPSGFVNLDAEPSPSQPVQVQGGPVNVHVLVHHHHKHHRRKPTKRDWESLTDRDALLAARDEILSGSSEVAAAPSTAAPKASDDDIDPDEAPAVGNSKVVVHVAAVAVDHSVSRHQSTVGYFAQGASWLKSSFLDALDFVCDGKCGIQRPQAPQQWEVVG